MTYLQSRVWAVDEQSAIEAIFEKHGNWDRLSIRPWEVQPRADLIWYEYYLLQGTEVSAE